MIQDVFIIGATGKVGKTVVRQIFERGDTDLRMHLNPTRVVGLASSADFIYSSDGLAKNEAYSFANREKKNAKSYGNLFELLDIITFIKVKEYFNLKY